MRSTCATLLLSGFLVLAVSCAGQDIDRRLQPIVPRRRVALVICNRIYQRTPLKNPVNDATDVATRLRELGYEVTLRTELGRRAPYFLLIMRKRLLGFDVPTKSYRDCFHPTQREGSYEGVVPGSISTRR